MTVSIHVAGWTLVHFVWQGALVGFGAAAALRLLRSASAQTRYGVACVAMAAMLAAPIITARFLTSARDSAFEPAALAVSIPSRTIAASTAEWFVTIVPARDVLPVRIARRALDPMLPLLVAAWLAGVALLLVRLAGGWWRVRRLHRHALASAGSQWQRASDRIAERLHLQRRVHLVDSPLIDTPTALGWLRPVVLLPIAALANLAPAQVEAILAHEIAHIRRHDYVVNLLQTVAETFLFYHPAMWWVSARIREEREHCCDDVAVRACGDAVGYAAALTELETWRTEGGSLALAATGGPLFDRVRRVLQPPNDKRSSFTVAMTTAIAMVLVAAGGRQLLAWQTRGALAAIASPSRVVDMRTTARIAAPPRAEIVEQRAAAAMQAADAAAARGQSVAELQALVDQLDQLRDQVRRQAQSRTLGGDEAAVMAVDEEYRLAKLHNDLGALDAVMHDDFVETNQNGHTYTKKAAIDEWRVFTIQSLTTDQADVRVVGNTAVVSGRQTERNGGGIDRMLFTRIYVKAGDKWQLLESMQFRDQLGEPIEGRR
jgi:beta-lactamase regulating signal transducer with metallopeptidase domain